MNQETYKTTMRILCLILSSLALACSATCMLAFLIMQNSELFKMLLLPTLIVCVFFTGITTLFAFINFASKSGKVAILLDIISIVTIVISFVALN